jgi:acyl carrier protein
MKTRPEIEKEIKSILVNQLNVNKEYLTDTASFLDDLGCDSLDLVEIFMAIEGEFKIVIEEDVGEKIRTYGELIEAVDKLVNPAA